MLCDTVVTEAGSKWTAACQVQQRFMQPLGHTIDSLSHSARCRQVYELGGDCFVGRSVGLTGNPVIARDRMTTPARQNRARRGPRVIG